MLWHKEERRKQRYVISKSLDAQLGIKLSKKLPFSKVKFYVDKFAEEQVPQFVDKIYKYCNDLQTVYTTLDENAVILTANFKREILMMIEKLVEIEKLQAIVQCKDQDDFQLRVTPAKLKITYAVEDFFETNSSYSFLLETSNSTNFSTNSRSHKAKDLLSYLGGEELPVEKNVQKRHIKNSPTKDNLKLQVIIENKEADIEAVELLNKDLKTLLKIMKELHNLVYDQSEMVDSIENHIENADDHIEDGNKILKKKVIAKAAMFPVVGAVIGGVIGGPIGFIAGMKMGSLTCGMAIAGIAGTFAGYQGGKMFKNNSTIV